MWAKKRFSQNFLLDAPILQRIVDLAGDLKDRPVLEIGPGPGGLTAALLLAGAHVTAFELDPDFAEFCQSTLPSLGHLDLRLGDVLASDGKELQKTLTDMTESFRQPVTVVSNLPYQIASVVLVELVQARDVPKRIVATIQAEVAERLCAKPGEKTRSLLTLLIGLRGEARRCFKISPGSFVPPPKVTSAVVEIQPSPQRILELASHPNLDSLLRRAFAGRRKMLRRSLADFLDPTSIAELGADFVVRRPQELSNADWLRLAQVIPQ